MTRLALVLIVGLCVAGVALILWGAYEECPVAEKAGLELVEEAVEAAI